MPVRIQAGLPIVACTGVRMAIVLPSDFAEQMADDSGFGRLVQVKLQIRDVRYPFWERHNHVWLHIYFGPQRGHHPDRLVRVGMVRAAITINLDCHGQVAVNIVNND
jgi:hypothetical protein